MNTVFIGGSRNASRLPEEVKSRLNNVIRSGHRVLVGDANGADKAVQRHFHDAGYDKVTVFCSGDALRNNVGQWTTRKVAVPENAKGFQFYAAKDREMAREADFGLMIWDGKSPGTLLNVLRLVRAGKIAVLFSVPERKVVNFRREADWDAFLDSRGDELRRELRARATPEEWRSGLQPSLLDTAAEVDRPKAEGSTPRRGQSLDQALAAGPEEPREAGLARMSGPAAPHALKAS